MFLSAPGNPTKAKKASYLVASTVLGMLLSFIVHTIVEITYLRYFLSQGWGVNFYGSCALYPAIQIGLWVAGALGGFLLGRFWWRLVYVERVWANRASFGKK